MSVLAGDVRRFVDMHNNWNFLRERVTESLGRYDCCNSQASQAF